MAWSVLQSNSADLDPGTTAVTFTTANVQSGTKLIAMISCSGSANPQVTAVADGASNQMTNLARARFNNSAANGELSLWAMDTPAGDVGTKPTLTATQSGGVQSFGMVIQEVSGLAVGNTTAMIDGTAVSSTGSIAANGSIAAGAYSTAAANEYLVALEGDNEASTLTVGTPTGSTTYTKDAKALSASAVFNCVPAFGNSTGGAETASFGITGVSTSTPWAIVFVAFKLAATTAPPAPLPARPGKTWQRRFKHRQQAAIAGPTSQDDTVNAPVAASDSSTQPQAIASIAPIAGVPVATGTAPQPTPVISPKAGAPAATGTASQPVISVTDFAGIPTATGSAAAVANPAAIAGTVTATGTAPAPGIAIQVLAGIPTATGTAPAPTVLTGTTVNAGIPTATGTAPGPVPAISVLPGAPTATGTAPQPAASPSAIAGTPTATGGAAAVANIGAVAGMPAATATASQPVASIAVKPGIPAATGTAPAPGILTGTVVNAGIPAATGTPPQPVAAASVFAGIPAATGTAPATSHGVMAGIPAATGTAAQAKTSAAVFAIIPAATGTAPQARPVSVLPFTVAKSTATVTAQDTSVSSAADPRDGTITVTAAAISISAVTDPRDATSSVTAPAASAPSVT